MASEIRWEMTWSSKTSMKDQNATRKQKKNEQQKGNEGENIEKWKGHEKKIKINRIEARCFHRFTNVKFFITRETLNFSMTRLNKIEIPHSSRGLSITEKIWAVQSAIATNSDLRKETDQCLIRNSYEICLHKALPGEWSAHYDRIVRQFAMNIDGRSEGTNDRWDWESILNSDIHRDSNWSYTTRICGLVKCF
jgi:hypothetical protein